MRGKFARFSIAIMSALALAACSGSEGNSAPEDNSAVTDNASKSVAEAAPSQGKLLFLQCAACHALESDAPAKVGPHLGCVVGRPAGSVEGFNYSQAFKDAAAGGLTWDRKKLLDFIANPRAVVPNNAMAFGGIADPDRAGQIVDYLEQECADAG